MLRLKNAISSEEHFQDKKKNNDAKPHSIYKFAGELKSEVSYIYRARSEYNAAKLNGHED